MTTEGTTARVAPPAPPGEPEPGWWIYRGTAEPHDGIHRLPPPPPWRSFSGEADDDCLLDPPQGTAAPGVRARTRGAAHYQAEREEIHLVNMALLLRRPLLVTGPPGVGKTTLAYSIARELRLGPVLRWSVSSRTTLREGQYEYDAIGRLQDVGLSGRFADTQPRREEAPLAGEAPEPLDVGHYLRLGPLGTALLPWRRPRVLLIDEIDKSDVDFPNDLLHVFEEGEFTVLELARLHQNTASVMTADPGGWAELTHGQVRCHDFPFVVMTSNGEREFPPAFLRRCIRLEIRRPDRAKLARLLAAHLPEPDGPESPARAALIDEFLRRQERDGSELAGDQLLNAVRVAQQVWNDPEERALVVDHLLRPLNEG
ncbi:MoxR family ATPase [Streptomyces cinnabarinus]|uniref:MoxR family ATPase n=1 Tax=Streptomyces cinnabarinus TaxID=67287 RepID=A0ABY7K5F1_9ACTN|nr:MoxR family ATPase [Streptomyces cinnabarinus]WAZ19738.1 MoxR family ATPase [Streptomyces cinnabarinus]